MKKLIIFLATALLATSCVDMDVPPKNVVTADQLLSDESGIDIYMARMYSYMPYEDFKYQGQWGFNFNGWLVALGIEGTGECLNRDGICSAFTREDTPYWVWLSLNCVMLIILSRTFPSIKTTILK